MELKIKEIISDCWGYDMKNIKERKLPMVLDYDNYLTEGNRETFWNSQYEANYKAKVNGFIVDFFKIPKSLKK